MPRGRRRRKEKDWDPNYDPANKVPISVYWPWETPPPRKIVRDDPLPPMPCPECREAGRRRRAGSSNLQCNTCMRYNQRVKAAVMRLMREKFPEEYKRIRLQAEMDAYYLLVEDWTAEKRLPPPDEGFIPPALYEQQDYSNLSIEEINAIIGDDPSEWDEVVNPTPDPVIPKEDDTEVDKSSSTE